MNMSHLIVALATLCLVPVSQALTLSSAFSLFISAASAQTPSAPSDPQHPGSTNYPFQAKAENFKVDGRTVHVFLPVDPAGQLGRVPTIVFGHGQAIDLEGYSQTFEHLAKKGVAVIFPQFDKNFFDQDWRRMADDFNSQTQAALARYSKIMDESQVVYAGHSKGGYIALMAAGAPSASRAPLQIGALVLFAPAGYDAQYIKNLNPKMPVTILWGEQDTIIKKSAIQEIYAQLPSQSRQWIEVVSYSALSADHFYMLNKKYIFGGRNGVSAFHYFGTWKWLLGAAWDIKDGGNLKNPFIYGGETNSSGVRGLEHRIQKSW